MNYVEPIRNIEDVELISKDLKPKYSLIWEIGTQIGLRVSDILNLKIDIVDKDFVEVKEQKTGKYKKFPINDNLKKKIKYYYDEYRCIQFVKKHNLVKNLMFLGQQGCQLDRSQVYREIKKACNNLGLDVSVGTHTMRKTFGYHHYRQYADIALLQTIFNHSSPQITLRYIGITQDEIDDSYKNFCLSTEAKIMHEQAIELRNARKNIIASRYKDKKELTDFIKDIIAKENKKLIKTIKEIKVEYAPKERVVKQDKSTPLAEEVLKILQHQAKNGGLKMSNMAKFILQSARDNLCIEVER